MMVIRFPMCGIYGMVGFANQVILNGENFMHMHQIIDIISLGNLVQEWIRKSY